MTARTKVLLVEDNALFRAGLAQILEADGRFRVVGQVSRGADALPAAKELMPDLILIDLNMPAMSGIDAIRLLRTGHTEASIGVLSVFESGDAVRSAMEAGANGYLAKDSSSQELCQAAARLARGEEVMMVPRGMASDLQGDGAGGSLRRLTPREVAVLSALAGGSSYEAIAAGLDISQKTLRNHISNIYRKLRIYNRAQAVIVAIREGLVEISPR